MPKRARDTELADRYTKTIHSRPSALIDPAKNKFAAPLNVCVIGASRGIGAAIACAYAQAGAESLVLVARPSSSDELASVEQRVKEINPSVQTLTRHCDITSSDSVAVLSRTIGDKVPRLDILVLNSGYSGPVVLKVDEGDPRDFQDVFDVNVQGTYLVSHHFIPLLKASDGARTFIVVGSLAACITSGHIANTAYCISKFAQSRLVEFIAEQYGKEGILAVAVHPGAVNTEMADKTTPESFRRYDPGLCGAFCVWLSREKRMWLNGRLTCATWDVEELLEKKTDIEDGDLLKFGFRLGTSSSA